MEHKQHSPMGSAGAKSALAKDPVCGMSVDPATARHKAEHAGATYYFCSAGCRGKFVADPARYLGAAGAIDDSAGRAPVDAIDDRVGRAHRARLQQQSPAGAIYTCPMHPQI